MQAYINIIVKFTTIKTTVKEQKVVQFSQFGFKPTILFYKFYI